MPIVTVAGSSYTVPADGSENWGTDVANLLVQLATSNKVLQNTSSNFPLAQDLSFGTNYGLKVQYLKSQAANPASSGILRLGNNESLSWRNQANSSDYSLKLSTSNWLQFNSIDLADISTAQSLTNKTISGSSNTLSNIGYSSLALTTSIVNTDISASAAIALSKLATVTASRALVSDGSGNISASSVTSTTLGYLDATSSVQTQLDAKIPKTLTTTTGDMIYASSANTPARLPIGTDTYVLTSTSGVPAWAAPAAAPNSSYEISNLGLATSVGSSALTIAVKQADGTTNPSTGASAVKVGMRSSTLTSGLYNQRSITSALSMVISSGSTLGQVSALPARLFIYLIDNAGTLELAVSQKLYPETQLVSTTAEGGAGAADSATVMYSTTARSSVPFRLIGFLDNTQTTAGTWASAGTKLQVGSFEALTSETVAARYNRSSGFVASGSDTVINFDSSSYDTHSAVTTGASWAFTAPISGYYICKGRVIASTVPEDADSTIKVYYNAGLVEVNYVYRQFSTGESQLIANGWNTTEYLNAGQTIQVKIRDPNGLTYGNNPYDAWVAIERIK